jgi:uncharacterized protein
VLVSIVRLILLAGMFLLVGHAHGQMLWAVTDEDGGQNWLLGTMHSEDPRLLDFPPALMDALRESQRVALELVPDTNMLERLNQAMNYDTGRLHEVLEPDLYARVVELLDQAYGMGEPAVRRMKPWAAAMTLSMPPPQTGLFMDLALSFRASGMGKDVVALETLDEQLAFLEGLSKPAQIELLRQAVADFESIEEVFDTMIGLYLSSDLAGLEEYSRGQLEELDDEIASHFNQVGLIDRNKVMVERAAPYLAEGGLLIAVGALHLPGEHGLIELLRQQGYEVKSIY